MKAPTSSPFKQERRRRILENHEANGIILPHEVALLLKSPDASWVEAELLRIELRWLQALIDDERNTEDLGEVSV
jgi:hypothetical protein